MTLIGRVSVDAKLTPFGLSNLRCLSLLSLCHRTEIPVHYRNHYYYVRVFPLFTFRSFFLAFLNGLEHRRHIRQPFLALILFVGLMFLGWLTSILSEGLTILVPATTLGRIVSLMGPAVSLALLTELSTFAFFGTRIDEPPLDAPLLGFPFSGRDVAALSFDRRPLFLAVALQHDALDILQVR